MTRRQSADFRGRFWYWWWIWSVRNVKRPFMLIKLHIEIQYMCALLGYGALYSWQKCFRITLYLLFLTYVCDAVTSLYLVYLPLLQMVLHVKTSTDKHARCHNLNKDFVGLSVVVFMCLCLFIVFYFLLIFSLFLMCGILWRTYVDSRAVWHSVA